MKQIKSTDILACRSCGCRQLATVLDLGLQPIANALLETTELDQPEPMFPLRLVVCETCALAQISETIPSDVLFNDDYPYFSSFIPALLEHSRAHAEDLIAELQLGPHDLVVEIASNDGYLLRNFVEANIPALGVDPAIGPVEAARKIGVSTVHTFFGKGAALALVAEGKRARVMLANNVLAHVDNINDFIAGFALLLADDGIAEFEFPYIREMVERCAFDTIYHEHIFYYSLSALTPLFNRHGLHLNDVVPLEIHGGSLRLRVSKRPGASEKLRDMLAEEKAIGLDQIDYFRDFGTRVAQLREDLRAMLGDFRSAGKTIAAYGAAAKGATLLNFAQLDAGTIAFVVDRNTHKIGKYMPGVRLPILGVEAIAERAPDVLFILTWNFASEVVNQQRTFAESGGIFIRAIPSPAVIGS